MGLSSQNITKGGKVELEVEKPLDTCNSRCPKNGEEFVRGGKRYIREISKDGIRDILIPNQGENVNAVLFCRDEFEHVGSKTKFLTFDQKRELEKEYKRAKIEKAEESLKRKQELLRYSGQKEHVPGLSDLDLETMKVHSYMVQRARDMRQEEEDEIKMANKIIMGTQCQAIRDMQLKEKRLIERDIMLAQKAFEEQMERDRLEAIKKMEMDKLKDKQNKLKFVSAIKEQVKENDIQKQIKFEKTREEARLANEAAMEVKKEELEAYHKKLENQAKLREEMRQVNHQIHYIHDIEREEQYLLDESMRQMMQKKAEEEERWEEEKKAQAKEKELELAKIRSQQQRAQDTQAIQDTINALRIQEEKEREWRKKERQRVLDKMEEEANLNEVRASQILYRQKLKAIVMDQEREEVMKIAKLNMSEERRKKEKELERLRAQDEFRIDLLKQINEKEKKKMKERQEMFEEGLAIRLEEQNRQENLKKTMIKKIEGLKKNNLPDVYIAALERQLKI